MTVKIVSFSYRRAQRPFDADLVLDCRDLRQNPHNVASLRDKTGLDKEVQAYVRKDTGFDSLISRAQHVILDNPNAKIAFGCVGGKHRSVTCAEFLANDLALGNIEFEVEHLGLK